MKLRGLYGERQQAQVFRSKQRDIAVVDASGFHFLHPFHLGKECGQFFLERYGRLALVRGGGVS